MVQKFTAIYKKHGEWYLGWIEEIPEPGKNIIIIK